MTSHSGILFCLACHRAMPEPGPVCSRCGADQEAVRAELLSRLEGPPPRRSRLPIGPRPEPPLPLNAVADVACPTCHVPVPAGAPSCNYCGHPMLTDLPQWTPDDVLARRYLFAGIAGAIVGLLCLLSGAGPLFFVGGFLMIAALPLAFIGFGHNPLGWSETLLLGIVVVLGMLAIMVLFATIFMSVG